MNHTQNHFFIAKILSELEQIELPDVFNPYLHNCKSEDAANAVEIRKNNLTNYLEYYLKQPPTELWLAESGSYNGLRRTGLPLVPETTFNNDIHQFGSIKKATITKARNSYTNKTVWEEAVKKKPIPFLWNTVLAHPHPPHEHFKNRGLKIFETNSYFKILERIIIFFDFKSIVCIGRKAEKSISKLGIEFTYVRHPSQGGITKFKNKIKKL